MDEILDLFWNKPCQWDSFDSLQGLDEQDYIEYLYSLCQRERIEVTLEDVEKFITILNNSDYMPESVEDMSEYLNAANNTLNKIIMFNEKYYETGYYIMITNFVKDYGLAEKLVELENRILLLNYRAKLFLEWTQNYGVTFIKQIDEIEFESEWERIEVHNVYEILQKEVKYVMNDLTNEIHVSCYYQKSILIELLYNTLSKYFGTADEYDRNFDKNVSIVSQLLYSLDMNFMCDVNSYFDSEDNYDSNIDYTYTQKSSAYESNVFRTQKGKKKLLKPFEKNMYKGKRTYYR